MSREPVFNAPPGVVRAMAVLAVVHVIVWHMLPDATAYQVLEWFAFIPARYTGTLVDPVFGWLPTIWSPLTHQLLHGDITHLLLNCAWLLVFGGAVAQRIGGLRFLLLGVLSGVAGAAVFLMLRFGDLVPMIGASGAVSGLMGGAFRFFFAALDRGGFEMFRLNPRSIPLMTVRQTLSDRRFQAGAAVLVLINVFASLMAPSVSSSDGVAWQAHLGGFLFGLFCFDYFELPRRPRPHLVHTTLH